MSYVFVIVLFTLIASLEVLPLYALTRYEDKSQCDYRYLHVAINVLFIAWSIYDLNFGEHYPHGPSTLFLIVPAWPALMLFYGFGYPMILMTRQARIFGRIIASIYLIGCMVGVVQIMVELSK